MTRFYANIFAILLCLSASFAQAQLVKYGPWSGALTSNSVDVVAGLMQHRITSIEVSTYKDFRRFITFAEDQRSEGAPKELARYSLHSLTPDTTYYYRTTAGRIRESERIGTFRTLPVAGNPASFRFAVAADALSRSESSVYSEIRFQKPAFFLHLGNFHNENISTENLPAYFDTYREALTSANQSELFAAVPAVYTWDKLDFGQGRSAAHQAYRQFVPHYPFMPEPGAEVIQPIAATTTPDSPIAQAFSYGRVRFIILDERTARDPVDAPDGPHKSMLGAAQLDWLKKQLLHAAPTHPLIFIATAAAWHGTNSAASDDWSRYSHERAQLATWIEANNLDGICFLSGNGGILATNDGSTATSRIEGNFPEFHVGPIDRREVKFDGNWTQSPVIPKEIDEFFGLVDVEDNVTSIKVTFTGLNQYAQEQLKSSFVVNVSAR